MSPKTIRAILRAYEDGVTLEALSHLFKVTQHELIIMVHAYKIGKKNVRCNDINT